jgi:ABC-type branched-subunit amino acid transport system ATPase component/branched-subunit amino acid ABC-type transport system permease component
MEELIRFTTLGFGAGGLYALAAIGVVLIYRSSGVVNFAQGAIGMVGSYVYYEAYVQSGWPWPVAMGLGFGGSALVGITFQVLVMRRLRDASALTKAVATIALLVTLQGIASLRYDPAVPKLVPSILPNSAMEIFGTSVGADRVAILAIALVLTGILWAVYRFTTFGIATSAVAENPRAAASLAVSPGFVAGANWAVGSALGALASILLVPITGLEPFGSSFLVIPVLAAAVIGRFASFPATTAAGILIGVAQSLVVSPLVTDRWSQPGLPTAIPFVLVAVVLIVQGKAVVGKGEHFGRQPRVGSGRPAPVVVLAGVAASLAGLWFFLPDDLVRPFADQIIVAVVLLSFVVVTGYAGQISLAQGALAGVAALVCGWLDVSQGWPTELAALAGVAATVPIALVLGLAGARARGVSLAIVTLGFAVAIGPALFANPRYNGGAGGGYAVERWTVLGVDIDPIATPERYGTFALFILLALGLAVANLRRGRAGRRLLAIRTNERAAAALGISVVEAKVYAFVLGGALAAVGGVLVAYRQATLSFNQFSAIGSLFVLQNAVIGGVGLLGGPLVGSAFQPGTLGQEVTGTLAPGDAAITLAVGGGIALMVLLSFAPDGLAELLRRLSALGLGPLRRRFGRDRPAGNRIVRPDPDAPRSSAPRALRVTGLTVRFGGTTALSELDLVVEPGSIVGLIGPNGAGKSTAIEAITGFVSPDAGVIMLGDRNVGQLSREARARAGLSRSFQSLELFDDLTVLENIQAACEERDIAAYLTDLVHPGPARLSPAAADAIDDLGLADLLDSRAADLSYADRRVLAVARAMAGGPSVLLLDEPAAGLDEAQARSLGEMIRRLARERGVGVLLVEHNVDLVLSTCDRVVVLDFGHVIGDGTPEQIRGEPKVVDAYLGTSRSTAPEVVASTR